MGGPSQEEKNLQAEQTQATAQYLQQQTQLHAEQQDLLQTLTPMLKQQISNPTGFSPAELAQLNSNNVNATGAQYANVQKQLNQANATQNMAGLTSGVAAAETAGLKGAAAGTVATNAANIGVADARLAQEKSATAQSELLALQSGLGGQAVSMGQVENQSENQAFQQADTMQQQSSQMMNGIIGGVVQAGLGVATGGMSNILGGGSFFKPAS